MSMSGVPDAPDESCRHRETVRLPPSTAREIQRLVEEGSYPNRSAAIRAGVRLLIEHESGDPDGSDEPTDTATSPDSTGETTADGRGDAR
jgi:Arc/MetJ-type ribon-helix-helix transcriptional regulator